MKNIKELYSKDDIKTGESIYYVDENCNKPYTGVIYDGNEKKIHRMFQVKDGVQDGVEKIFHEKRDSLQQICDYKRNLQFGISKEFDEGGNLTYVGVVFNNKFMRILTFSNNIIVNREEDYDLNKYKYPAEIIAFLQLTDEELINYRHKELSEKIA